jgi:hypothetical protein
VIHQEPPLYRAFMLRCWEVRSPQPGGPTAWRFSLEDPHTGQKHGFADLEALNAFLEAELAQRDSTREE